MRRLTRFTIMIILLVCLSGRMTGAETVKIKAASTIDKVTVFSDRAMVKRVVKRNFKPGIYTVEIPYLPPYLIDSSIQVSGKGSADATVLNVRIDKVYLTDIYRKEVKKVYDKMKAVENKIQVLKDRSANLTERGLLLKALVGEKARTDKEALPQRVSSLLEWEKMLNFYEKQLNKVSAEKRKIGLEQEKLEEDKHVLGKELMQSRSSRPREVKSLFIDLEVKKEGSLKISAAYVIYGATWTPTYDLRLSSVSGSGTLNYSALVKQSTGEDWKNVRMTLSTAKPAEVKSMPEIFPRYLGIRETGLGEIMGEVALPDGSAIPGVTVSLSGNGTVAITRQTNDDGKFFFANVPSGRYRLKCELEGFNTVVYTNLNVSPRQITKADTQMFPSTIKEEITISESVSAGDSYKRSIGSDSARRDREELRALKHAASEVSERGISSAFTLRRRDSVPSDDSPRKTVIAVKRIAAELRHTALPGISGHVYQEAVLKNQTEAPLLPGSMNVFLDGTFVNTAAVDLIQPGRRFELPVGVDEAVKIEREMLSTDSKSGGVFKRSTKKEQGYQITVENLHRKSRTVRVLDQVPVSRDKAIKVEIIEMTPQPVKDKDEEAKGIYKWELALKPGEKKVIRVRYTVSHPKGAKIEEQNFPARSAQAGD